MWGSLKARRQAYNVFDGRCVPILALKARHAHGAGHEPRSNLAKIPALSRSNASGQGALSTVARFNAQSGEICFQHRGSRADPRVLLIHGLGCQLVQWPEALLEGLVRAGYCVVVFDNRDAGLSHAANAPTPSLAALLAGRDAPTTLQPAYTLSDMAQDAVDLLDHLGQAGAHVVGLSMGGMIAQRMAIEHPQRVYSLTSIMSSTGGPQLPHGTEEAEGALLATLAEEPPEAAVAHVVAEWKAFGGPHFDSEQVGIGRLAARAVARAFRPAGTARQLAAILADGDRTGALANIAAPTLVLHGQADPLVPVEAGRATAAAIPGATITEFEKLGHDLPAPLIDPIVQALVAHLSAVEVSR